MVDERRGGKAAVLGGCKVRRQRKENDNLLLGGGRIVAIVGAALHWVSQVQKITLTSNEAEYVVICRAMQGIVFLRHHVLMLNAEQHQATTIIDNTTGTTSCAEANAQSKRPRNGNAETTDGEK